jgi:hypothetical protein
MNDMPEGRRVKGGQNPPNTSTARPPAPNGSKMTTETNDLLEAAKSVLSALDASQAAPYIAGLDVNALRAAVAKASARSARSGSEP